MDLNDEYQSRYVCRLCYRPVESGGNGVCTVCLHSKDLFPVNYLRVVTKEDPDEEDEY